MDFHAILALLKGAATFLYTQTVALLVALSPLKGMILERFGYTGLIAAYIAVTVIGLLIIYRLMKVTFAAIKYLVIPAVGLALLASICLPYSFAAALPVTVTGCSLVLLLKG
jgi:hypothetical protein